MYVWKLQLFFYLLYVHIYSIPGILAASVAAG